MKIEIDTLIKELKNFKKTSDGLLKVAFENSDVDCPKAMISLESVKHIFDFKGCD